MFGQTPLASTPSFGGFGQLGSVATAATPAPTLFGGAGGAGGAGAVATPTTAPGFGGGLGLGSGLNTFGMMNTMNSAAAKPPTTGFGLGLGLGLGSTGGSTGVTPLGFGSQQQLQMPMQQAQAVTHLTRKDRHPVTYATKIEELDDNSKQLLQALEKKIKQHRDHKRQLETFERLQAGKSNANQRSKMLRDELDMEVHVLSKKVQGLLSLLKADKQSLDSLYQICMKLVRRTEDLSNASQRLKLRATTMQQMQGSGHHHQGMMSLPGDLGFRPPVTPSPFLVEALANFEHSFDQMSHVVGELEQLHLQGAGSQSRGVVQEKSGGNGPVKLQDGKKDVGVDKSMSKILDNFVVYFNHVLAQYSQVHEKLHKVKKQFKASQKQHGVERDYFAEADRKAVAAEERLKKEAEQKKQQVGQTGGPLQTPAQQPQTVPSLFSTPAQQVPGFGASPTPTTPLFGGAGQTNAFGVGVNTFGGGGSGGGGKSKSKSKRGK